MLRGSPTNVGSEEQGIHPGHTGAAAIIAIDASVYPMEAVGIAIFTGSQNECERKLEPLLAGPRSWLEQRVHSRQQSHIRQR
jgi:hypothetical protein